MSPLQWIALEAVAAGPLTIKVVDGDELPVPFVQVVIVPADGGPLRELTTDDNGEVADLALSDGFYVVRVDGPELAEAWEAGLVVPGDPDPLVIAVRFRPAPESVPCTRRSPPVPEPAVVDDHVRLVLDKDLTGPMFTVDLVWAAVGPTVTVITDRQEPPLEPMPVAERDAARVRRLVQAIADREPACVPSRALDRARLHPMTWRLAFEAGEATFRIDRAWPFVPRRLRRAAHAMFSLDPSIRRSYLAELETYGTIVRSLHRRNYPPP